MGRPRKSGNKEKETKRRVRVHDPEIIKRAIESVKAGEMSQRNAAKTFGIPFSTLNDKIVGHSPLTTTKGSLLSPEEEDKLVKFILDMAKCGFGQTTDDIRRTAQAIIDIKQPPEEGKNNMPSAAWVYRFFERHPQLTLRSTMGLGKERATVTPQAILTWFNGLRECVQAIDPSLLTDASRIYNADESGFAFDTKGRKVAAFKGAKHVYNLTSNTKTQAPKKPDPKAGAKKGSAQAKPKKEGKGGKAKKKKWSKGKVRDKLNNLVLFDKPTYDKLYKEVPGYKLITPSVVSERLKIRVSLAKMALAELYSKGLIRLVSKHATQLIYTRVTKAET